MAQRFTVYDVLEGKGVFRKNPANLGAQDETGQALYSGPVQYPRMLYHPTGEERIIQEGEVINTPLGPKLIMQQREIIWQIVHTAEEEDREVAKGWHKHPADSMRAAGKEAPATGADHVIANLRRQIEQLQQQQRAVEQATGAPPTIDAEPGPKPATDLPRI